ncbi:MAG: hypothetical protein JXO22_17390, partial [Phycisphaerae bacterium]|nr:hypothetical protein [Phycisphaerae bacterium]
MSSELARADWRIEPLGPDDCGPYAGFPRQDDRAKSCLWEAYHARRPERVPLTLGVNDRVFMLDETYNTAGLTYDQIFDDAEAMLIAHLRADYLLRMRHHHFCDMPTDLPQCWRVTASFQNVYEASAFGAPLDFPPGNVPCTRPILTDDRKRAIFDVDIDRPLELGVYKRGVEMTHAMRELARGRTFLGRPIEILPYCEFGSDGPLTVALNLRGPAIFADLKRDPEYAREMFDLIVTAAIKRCRAFEEYWGLVRPEALWLADDALASIGVKQYVEHVLPHHRKLYDALDADHTRMRGMHLCGDATRHFRTIRDELGVTSFDTGYPVDFAGLRAELGPA